MSVSSVSGNSVWAQMQQFRSGKTNLQKTDLQQMQQQAAQTQSQNQTQSASPFDSLLALFDEIDQNQDGISIDELKSFAAENGMQKGGPGGSGKPAGPPPGPPLSMMFELGPTSRGGGGEMPESVSKEELLEIQSQMEAEGMEVPKQLSKMIENFESLDSDQDGKVSIDEMMAAQEQESATRTDDASAQKLDLLKLIEQYANEYSSESSASSASDDSSDASKDMAIKFMRAINQYSSFASYSNQSSASSLFEIDA